VTKTYELSPASRQDLVDIEDATLEQFGLEQALRMHDEFAAAFEKLAENPGLGHIRENLSPSGKHFHYWPVKKTFLIVYRAGSSPLQIVRVLHGKRHVKAILGE